MTTKDAGARIGFHPSGLLSYFFAWRNRELPLVFAAPACVSLADPIQGNHIIAMMLTGDMAMYTITENSRQSAFGITLGKVMFTSCVVTILSIGLVSNSFAQPSSLSPPGTTVLTPGDGSITTPPPLQDQRVNPYQGSVTTPFSNFPQINHGHTNLQVFVPPPQPSPYDTFGHQTPATAQPDNPDAN
jgi:hypothetical protein